MKRIFLDFLNFLSKNLLPSYYDKDLTKLSKIDKAIVAFKYWLTINRLKE